MHKISLMIKLTHIFIFFHIYISQYCHTVYKFDACKERFGSFLEAISKLVNKNRISFVTTVNNVTSYIKQRGKPKMVLYFLYRPLYFLNELLLIF